MTHVVRAEPGSKFSSPSLDWKVVRELESSFKTPWWLDGWSRRAFRSAAVEIMRRSAPDGLVFIGRRMSFETPPPFTDAFEPIELGAGDPQLKTLSGDAPTKEERANRWIFGILGVFGALTIIWVVIAVFRKFPPLIIPIILGPMALVVCIIFLVSVLEKMTAKWYLVPGGVVIVKSGAGRDRMAFFTRLDSCAVVRMISTGKSAMRALEVWSATQKLRRRRVSEREALAFLAAWQSPLPPPEPDRLRDLA